MKHDIAAAVLVALTALVLVFSVLNLLKEKPADVIFETSAGCTGQLTLSDGGSYFDNARFSRKQSRDEAVSVLKAILNASGSGSEEKKDAAAAIAAYARRSETETQIENRVLAKGFEECIAFVSDKTVSLMVKTDGLERAQAAQILEIIIKETNYPANVVKIIEIK